MIRYPAAEWLGNGGPDSDGLGYGPLPDRGGTREQIRVVFHTVEGDGLPDYDGVDPHLTYLPRFREWAQHVEFDRRCGTLVGISRTGVLGNEISIQVEIAAYSDKALAEKRDGLWVGDFTDDHYHDLAAFIAWARANLFVPHLTLDRAYGPSDDFDSFAYGLGDSHEMSKTEWLAAGGILTGHGAAPGQRHWDPGVLDLHRIIRESLTINVPSTPPAGAQITTELGLGDTGPQVANWQRLLNQILDAGLVEDGQFGPLTEAATKQFEAAVVLEQDGLVSVAQARIAGNVWEQQLRGERPRPLTGEAHTNPPEGHTNPPEGHSGLTITDLGVARGHIAAALEELPQLKGRLVAALEALDKTAGR